MILPLVDVVAEYIWPLVGGIREINVFGIADVSDLLPIGADGYARALHQSSGAAAVSFGFTIQREVITDAGHGVRGGLGENDILVGRRIARRHIVRARDVDKGIAV